MRSTMYTIGINAIYTATNPVVTDDVDHAVYAAVHGPIYRATEPLVDTVVRGAVANEVTP
jgi:hypothetical protein